MSGFGKTRLWQHFSVAPTSCHNRGRTVICYDLILAGALETVNLNKDTLNQLTNFRQRQPNKPLYVSEFWPGWFDTWGAKHHTMTTQYFEKEVTDIIFKVNSSINFYMFTGGTNFGFMNGGHVITSYDYNAPLSESGL